MDPIIGASLIGAGSGLLSGIFGSSAQASANRTNIQLQREAQAWNESMWNKQNEYNTPAAQIQRMREAGLNPALMYSQGNVGNAESVKPVAPAQVQPITGLSQGIASAGDAIADGIMKLEQVKQMRAQTKMLEARANKTVAETMTPDEYRKFIRAKIFQTDSSGQYYNSKAAGQDIYNLSLPGLLINQKRKGELQNNQIQIQNQKLQVDMAVQAATIQLYKSKIILNNAQSKYYFQAVKLAAQKYNFLELMNPLQINKVLGELQLQAKDIDWYDADHKYKYWNLLEKSVVDALELGAKYADSVIPF